MRQGRKDVGRWALTYFFLQRQDGSRDGGCSCQDCKTLFHKRFISSDRGRLLSGTLINASPFSSCFKIMGSVHKVLINSYSLGDIPPFPFWSRDCKHFASTNKGCILIHGARQPAPEFVQLTTATQGSGFSLSVYKACLPSSAPLAPPKVLLISKLHKIGDLSKTL